MDNRLVVGVTGHRDPLIEMLPRLRELVYEELKKLKEQFPEAQPILIDSLAAGADCLCAEEALSLGYRLVCPLPVEKEIYQKDFSAQERAVFDRLLSRADEVFVAPWTEQGTDTRDHRFRQAGLYVADHSDVLLALWDGSAAKPGGCGTAEIADYMLQRCCREPVAVVQIVTPRESGSECFPPEVRWREAVPGQILQKLGQETEPAR